MAISDEIERAIELAQGDQLDEAVAELQRIRELGEPEGRASVLRNLSVVLQQLERYDEMLDATAEYIALLEAEEGGDDETRSESYELHAVALQHLGKLAKALKVIDKALALDRADASNHYEKACILVALSDHEAAIACVREAVKLDPSQRKEILADVDLEPLHGNPEFDRLVRAKKAKPRRKAR